MSAKKDEVTRTVRVTRTWDVVVPAVYGDTDASLKAKVTEKHLDDTKPDGEDRVILENAESDYDYYVQLLCVDCTPGNLCDFHVTSPKTMKEA